MRGLKKGTTAFLISFFISTVVLASMFGEESAILTKILVEDIQQTLNLKNIFEAAGKQLSALNEKYGYDKWINRKLDEVKDFGLLDAFKTDDFVIGTFQYDMGKVGTYFRGKEYNFNNIDDWMDQLWGTSPPYINSRPDLRSAVSQKNAQLAYQHYLYNLHFNRKIKARYEALMSEATEANPGQAARLSAQTNALQNLQLANLNDTQSDILKLMSMKELEHQHDTNEKRFNLADGFEGISNLVKKIPTIGK